MRAYQTNRASNQKEQFDTLYKDAKEASKGVSRFWVWLIVILLLFLVFGPATMRSIGANIHAFRYLKRAIGSYGT